MTKIILLMGIGSTGKTTLANQLVKVLDEDYMIDRFDRCVPSRPTFACHGD